VGASDRYDFVVALPARARPGGAFRSELAYTQPDGTQIRLWGQGDEFYAVTENLEGYTVVFDPASKTYYYARPSTDGSTLLPTAWQVGRENPDRLGLPKHLRPRSDAVRRLAWRGANSGTKNLN